MIFRFLKTVAYYCIPMPYCWRIRDTKGCTNTIRTRPCRSKRKKGQPLSAEDKAHNKTLSKQRVFIEHINRRCKIFRIVKEVYRGKHKNYSLNWNLVAALVNLRYRCI